MPEEKVEITVPQAHSPGTRAEHHFHTPPALTRRARPWIRQAKSSGQLNIIVRFVPELKSTVTHHESTRPKQLHAAPADE
jgi:hypothetical protein